MKDDFLDKVLYALIVLAIIFAVLMVVLLGFVIHDYAESQHFYAKSAVVVEIDRAGDTVICEDCNGFRWAFRGVEDWEIGDGVSLLMHDRGTPRIYDDEIKGARYEAWNFSR